MRKLLKCILLSCFRRITLFTDNMIEGLHLAISSMKIGEISWFKFSPNYHYFNEKITNSIQQDLKMDKSQALFYKVEFLEYKNNDGNTYEGRIEHFAYCKMKGNEAFKENKYEEAFKVTKKLGSLKEKNLSS